MKVQANSISIEISLEEWNKVQKEWRKLTFADKPKVFEIKTYPNLHDFMNCIDMVAKNLNHTIDKKVNEY